jgi:glycerophosphoryl diester phosphodiesterase
MEILNTILAAIISAAGLPVGFLLARIAKEELKDSEFYFIWMQNIVLIFIINLFFYSLKPKLLTILPVFIVTTIFVLKFKPRAIISYFAAGVFFYLSMDEPQNILLMLSSLIFLYGFPTAALIKVEGIKAESIPLRYIAKKIKIIGHRGAPGYMPENTLSSFKTAIHLGVDMLEADVRMTKDRRLVIMHDATVDRTTNGKGHVCNMMYSRLRNLRINKKEKIPTIQELIELVNNRCAINFHLKEHEAVEELVNTIKKNNIQNKVIISSFSALSLKKIKEIAPEIKTAYLYSKPMLLYIDTAKELGVSALHPPYSLLTKRLVMRAHRHGLKINVWGIEDRVEVFRAKFFYGVDGLIIDDPLLYASKKKHTI